MNDNKFKVGEKVIYDNRYKATIFGVADKADFYGEYAAISITTKDGNLLNTVVREDTLSKPLNKNKLEAGDVCKQKGNNRLKILCRANDEYSDEVTYFIKHITGKRKGLTDVIPAETIKEIFYNYTFKEK
jgi:hypothetical protein